MTDINMPVPIKINKTNQPNKQIVMYYIFWKICL